MVVTLQDVPHGHLQDLLQELMQQHRQHLQQALDLDPDTHKIIACHLGGSSSVCAFKDGKSLDTSMGFTPQTGLIQSVDRLEDSVKLI